MKRAQHTAVFVEDRVVTGRTVCVSLGGSPSIEGLHREALSKLGLPESLCTRLVQTKRVCVDKARQGCLTLSLVAANMLGGAQRGTRKIIDTADESAGRDVDDHYKRVGDDDGAGRAISGGD